MRELPEVETTRRDLDRDVGGRKVKSVEVLSMKAVPRLRTKKALGQLLDGRKFNGVSRKGLYLLFDIGEGDILVADMGSSAHIRRQATKEAMPDGTLLAITFTQGGQLRWVDAGETGEMFCTTTELLNEDLPQLGTLGFDPVDQPISWRTFGQMVLSRSEKLKALLTDPTFMVGIGAVYSDEILHEALLRGDRPGDQLTIQEIRRLYRATVETMHAALKYRGVSLGEYPWFDTNGESGGYLEYLEVYERAGLPSRNGRGRVAKTRVANQTHFYADYQV
jgi:formamidopyrimidine-DNA glycosylase